MTEILRNEKQLGRVLEVGTGCGYQSAVLSHVAIEVYTVERIQPLFAKAKKQLFDLKLRNVNVRHADGTAGLTDGAPFDGIIMACAAPALSATLKEQLAVGGRMVLPIGTQEQFLYLIEREANGYRETRLEAVKFVPLLMGKA
jgi:protein-L-isoaspartate(D-aspartate) O-methyltransferase